MGNPVVGTQRSQTVQPVLESTLDVSLNRAPAEDRVTCSSEPNRNVAFSLAPGDLIAGRYHIVRIIGRGGMGEVYEAVDGLLHEHIAIKTLRSDLARNEISLWRFRKEIQLARKVTHPNVCRVFEVGTHEYADSSRPPLHFFTMELLKGETLSSRIRRLKRLPKEQAIPIAIQIAEGLQAAHAVNVIHMDFKSGNIMLIESGPDDQPSSPAMDSSERRIAANGKLRAVITDFGLATAVAVLSPTADTITMPAAPNRVAGTLAYMSPEQLTGRVITQSTDIYSFGIVLYEMATGQLPFDVQNVVNSAVQRASGEVVTARLLVPDLDPRWDAAITKCLQKAPENRFATAGEIADWLGGGALRLPRLLWTRRDWMRATAAGIGVAAAGGAAVSFLQRTYRPKPEARDWYDKGVSALHSMTFEAARKALEQAVAADPKFALAHASLARAYEELDYSDLAKDSILRALTLAETTRLSSEDLARLHAFQYMISRDYDRAGGLFAELESKAEGMDKPAAAVESGWAAQQREDTEGAAAAYERALKLAPRYAAAKLRLGYLQGRRRQVAAALQAFTEAESLYSASNDFEGATETLIQKASLLNRSSRSKEALPLIERALAVARTLNSVSQQIRLELLEGVAFRNLGNTKRASELAQHAVEAARAERMDNVVTGGLIDLGNAFLVRGDWQAAEQYYRNALDFARRNKGRRNEARAQFSLGSLFEQTNQPDDALGFLQAALPFYRQAGYRRELVQTNAVLGGVHAERGDFDEAVRILRGTLPQAVALHDPQVEVQLRERLAACLRDQGAWPDALAEYEHAVASAGPAISDAGARLGRIQLLWRLGKSEEAEKALQEMERSLPNTSEDLLHIQFEIAYGDSRLEPARDIATRLHDPVALVLVKIRSGGSKTSLEAGTRLIHELDGKSEAATARLDIAEALLSAKDRNTARAFAAEALTFFEPRHLWESAWRAHAVAAATSSGDECQSHKEAARAALDELRKSWPPDDVESYLRRSSINVLYKVCEV